MSALDGLSSVELYTIAVTAGTALALVSVPAILIQRRGRPVGALAWILAVLSLPVVGLLLWWLVGFNSLRRKRNWRKRSANAIRDELVELKDRIDARPIELPEAITSNQYGVFPPTDGNAVRLLVDGEDAFPSMVQAIENAQDHVHFLFYIWQRDEWGTRLRDAMTERAKAGVQVRALYDDLGSASVDRRFLRPLVDAGAKCLAFLPNRLFRGRWSINFRNHRKILVVDGRVAFIGGINIGDEYASEGWRDFAVRLEGPVVDQIQEVFADDWHFASNGESIADKRFFGGADVDKGGALCSVVASGPDTESQETLDAFFVALNSAKRRVWVMSPYFVPEKTIVTSLRTLCLRGVEVTLVLPGVLDHNYILWTSRTYFRELLASGVKIFEYQPNMLHGKAMVVDDAVSYVGSANIDNRSFA
ncbi:MAG: cardiolipin synthase, partial [Myxococcota bacterium]